MLIVGIDPGEKSGGIAWIDVEGNYGAEAMPDTHLKLVKRLHELCGNLHVFLEHLQPLPSRVRGAVASFKLGTHYGMLQGILISYRLPFTIVRPQLWQGRLGCSYPGQEISYAEKKKRNRILAQKLFPDIKVTHAIADALLIAEYGRRVLSE